MAKTETSAFAGSSRPGDATSLSLVQGGPLFQFLLRIGLINPSMDLAVRRIVVITLVAWAPLLLLTALSGHAIGGSGVSFLADLGAQARLLLCVPLLIGAEVVVHRRISSVVRQFVARGIVVPADQPQFESVVASAVRIRNSWIAEVVLLALAIGGGYTLGKRYIAMDVQTWFSVPVGGQSQLAMAGYWYLFVSLTIFRFLLLRWYFRLFVWYRFLWQVSRHVPLRLNALHPDRAGGLSFLSLSVFAFAPVMLAQSLGLAGILGGKIWHEGATLPEFKIEIVVWMLLLMLAVLAPLFFFMPQLAEARRTGLSEYGIVASKYVTAFRRKWIDPAEGTGEAMLGTGDIQSLADLTNSFDVVRETALVPFRRALVLRLAILLALPLLPLTLTMIPLEQVIDRALEMFM